MMNLHKAIELVDDLLRYVDTDREGILVCEPDEFEAIKLCLEAARDKAGA